MTGPASGEGSGGRIPDRRAIRERSVMPGPVPEEDQDSPAPCPDTCPDRMLDAATDDQRGHSNRGEGTATDTPEAGERRPGVQTEGRPRITRRRTPREEGRRRSPRVKVQGEGQHVTFRCHHLPGDHGGSVEG